MSDSKLATSEKKQAGKLLGHSCLIQIWPKIITFSYWVINIYF